MATPISDRYRRYKAGTTKITRWLKKASKGCVGIEKSIADLCITDDAGLTTQGLIKLAEAIASSTHPEVEIPLEILVVIEDVVGGRQASAEWYAGTGDGSDEATKQANHRHRNFIEVLKQILNVLNSKYEDRLPRWEKKKPQKLKQEKAKIVENIYQYLDIEEPAIDSSPTSQDDLLDNAPSQQTQPVHHAPGSLAKDIVETDKIFALWCYFKDQYDSCNFLKETWQEYKDGELSLQTVCQVTDTAFMLMKKACATLVTEYPQFADMHDVDSFLGFEKSTVGGKLTIVAFREKLARPDGDCSKPALHELFCTKASCIMDHFGLMVCTNVNVPLEARNLSNAFAPCLYSLAPEIRLLAQADLLEGHTERHVPLVHEDNFLNGLIKLCKSKCLSPWLVTACQTYMHIYDVLDSRVVEGHEELHRVAPKLGQAMAEHKKYMMSLHDWVWPPLMSPGIDYFRKHLLQQVERDHMRRLQEHFPLVELRNLSPPFRWQKHLPVTCGTVLFTSQQGCHTIGVLDSNTGLTILAAAHLYKAARLAGVLEASQA
ncbi:hypothetical protein LTR27_002248 [Elasticomyces elasticus]|nr:hypothetical protein LTR27_002248 [Elasticomyces elasticus]